MFGQLTDDLLDLTATEKGYGAAMLAVNEEPGCCGISICSTVVLCCSIHICW
jgi:hypothetical protein